MKEEERERRLRDRDIARIRRKKNRPFTFVSVFFVLIFVSLIGYLIYFDAVKSDDFINSPYNTRQDTFSDRVVRGNIQSSDGEILAQTDVSEDGTEQRNYPYANIFAHAVGYDTNGKSGLESEANFQLLTSHSFFLEQMKNEFSGKKNQGDTVISSLNADLQTTAYNSLGDRRGAVVVMEPSTGRILAMVSKPDFDPNTIAENWNTLVNDENNSSLLNRATNGAYPPGSTFKIVTALDYFRQKGSLEGYSYLCQGSITVDEELLEAAGILEYEKVQIVDVNNGSRFETYTICGKRGSGMICLNGAAARCVSTGDKIIIMAYAGYEPEEARTHKPAVVFVDEENKISRVTNYEKHGLLKDMA